MGATEVDGHSFKDIGLPEFTVISRKESETGDILYTVEPKERIADCPACGGKLHIHKDAKRKVKDLDEFGHRVGIVVKGKSYRCKDCGETVREEYASICGQMTRRMVESIQRDVFGDMTFTQIARRYNVSVSTVQGLFEEQGEKLWTAYHFVTPRVLGIDEVHLNNAYYGVFVNVDRQNGGIIELSEERSKNAVIDVLKRLENPENLCYVTMDMWRPYYDAVKQLIEGSFRILAYGTAHQSVDSFLKVLDTELTCLDGVNESPPQIFRFHDISQVLQRPLLYGLCVIRVSKCLLVGNTIILQEVIHIVLSML